METREDRISRLAARVYIAYTRHELELIEFLRRKIGSDDRWALRAMNRVYDSQTDDEKEAQSTSHINGIGFNGLDANIMSSMRESYEKYGRLTPKQMAVVKKIMIKYAKQIFSADYCDKDKLEAIYQRENGTATTNASRITGRVLKASAFSDIGAELAKVEIDEYGHFVRVHNNEWMCFPKNRNAHIPIIYVIISGGKYVAGYKYLDETENKDCEGAPQDSVSGLLEEIAIIKSAISDVVTMEKNRVMDKKIDEEQAGTEEEGGGGGEDDGGFGGGDDEPGGGMGGGGLGDLG